MSTNPPVAPPEDSTRPVVPVTSPTDDGRRPTHVPAPDRPRSWAATLISLGGWLFTIAVIAAAWRYQDRWLPQVRALVEKGKPAAPKPPRIVPVTTELARRRDMPLYLNGLGTVTAFRTVTIRSRVEGELIHVHFKEGDMVEQDKLLAEIDPRPFEVQLAQAEGQLARDQAILKTARLTLNRYEELLPSKAVTAQQLDEQAAIVQQTTATIQTTEALVANAKLQLSYCKIEAPIAGRIGLRQVDQGNIVVANDPVGLAVITQLQPIAVIFTIPQDEIARVLQRNRAEKTPLPVEAFDRDFKQSLAKGGLLAIDNQVDAATGTVRIKAEFKNEDGVLFPNQFVNARLLVDTRRGVTVVPTAAIQRGPSSLFVYVVRADETVEVRNVVTGPSDGPDTVIESGIEVGEVIATDGLDKLQPDAKVAPRRKGDPETRQKEKVPGGAAPRAEPPAEPPAPSKSRPGSSDEPRTTTATREAVGSESGGENEGRPKPSTSCDETEEATANESGGARS